MENEILFKKVNELTAKYPNLTIGELNELRKLSGELSQGVSKYVSEYHDSQLDD